MIGTIGGSTAARTAPARSSRRAWYRFRHAQGGATAVEFGLVALPFFALLFAIMETALAFWANQVLETAVATAARQIYTGQFQQDPANANKTTIELASKFKDSVCANVTALFDCSQLAVDVRTFSDTDTPSVPLPITNGVFDTSSFGYQAPQPRAITVIRAAMQYPSFTRFLDGTTGLSNGDRLIMASSTFKTEPYSPNS